MAPSIRRTCGPTLWTGRMGGVLTVVVHTSLAPIAHAVRESESACDGWAVTKPRAGEWRKPTAWLRRASDSLWFLVFAVVFVIAAVATERWVGVSSRGSGRLVGLILIVVIFGAYFGSDVLGSRRERRKGRHKKRSH